MSGVEVRQLAAADIEDSERIRRLAFGTFLGAPDPSSFRADIHYARSRQPADPSLALGAYLDGELVGSNFVTVWGSFGFFGPLSVLPAMWDSGIGQALLGPTIELLEQRGVSLSGLYTFPNSPKHLALYQKFGFWPRYLTAIMSIPVGSSAGPVELATAGECRAVTDAIYRGLDITREIAAVQSQALGAIVAIRHSAGIVQGFAVCHCGAGTEAGEGVCYVKFAAAQDEPSFDRLLDSCLGLAA
ncbi:MAG: GNAT family N-acetyltransferase, partial [Chloroflexi bacterium]|nr:GNAT family N-acetyltransferase [Chloroflexota bacterium]